MAKPSNAALLDKGLLFGERTFSAEILFIELIEEIFSFFKLIITKQINYFYLFMNFNRKLNFLLTTTRNYHVMVTSKPVGFNFEHNSTCFSDSVDVKKIY